MINSLNIDSVKNYFSNLPKIAERDRREIVKIVQEFGKQLILGLVSTIFVSLNPFISYAGFAVGWVWCKQSEHELERISALYQHIINEPNKIKRVLICGGAAIGALITLQCAIAAGSFLWGVKIGSMSKKAVEAIPNLS